MVRFIARRVTGMVAVLFAISVIVFLIFNVVPNSNPAIRIAGKNANPELITRVSADLGLDQPVEVLGVVFPVGIRVGRFTPFPSRVVHH